MTDLVKKICCIGAGYVGGPTMAVMAYKCKDIQFNVVDTNQSRIDRWNDKDLSNLPIYEPGLDKFIHKCRNKNLFFSTDVEKYISESDMIFISVNTPIKTSGIGAGKASDLKWVEVSARQISRYARGNTIVVEKSTLPVKTAETIKQILDTESTNMDISNSREFTVLSNPEFLSEGNAINDLLEPDRILIGGNDESSINALASIYRRWVAKEKIITTNLWSSELSKLIANAFLAQRVSSINSVSALCEETGAHIKDVSLAVGLDKRIGEKFLEAGPGFGGSCFKKDILNLVYICDYYGLHEVSKYWNSVIEINEWQQKRIPEIILKRLFGTISGKKIVILGFSFKANTNDTRNSPAINICKRLIEEGANLMIYDPKVSAKQIGKELGIKISNNNKDKSKCEGSWSYCESTIECFLKADAAVILTEWQEFKKLDYEIISRDMRKPAWIFDTRGVIDIEKTSSYNLNIWTIGNGMK